MGHMYPSTRRYVDSRRIAADYDNYFAGSALFAFDSELLRRWLSEPGRVVDIGCGTGRHLVELARMGHQPVGVDLSATMLETATRKLAVQRLAVSLIRADVIRVGALFAPRSFDYAVCMFSTLGLIAGHANRLTVLRGVRRILKPGGLFALHVHNLKHNVLTAEGLGPMLGSAVRHLLGRGEWGDKVLSSYRGIRDMVIHVFSRDELLGLLREAGLEAVEVVPLNHARDGALTAKWAVDWRANGFVVLARRPAQTVFEAALENTERARRAGLAEKDRRGSTDPVGHTQSSTTEA